MGDYTCCVPPSGLCESPSVYRNFSEAKVAYLRSKGMPALTYLYDSWVGHFQATHGQSARQQWLTATKAIHDAMLVPLMRGYFLAKSRGAT